MEFVEQLLNVELGLPARFLIAFVFVLLLIALTAWVIRRLAAGRNGLVGGLRARQHRITVVDSAGVDAKRRLVLVRWDNSEHLLLVGGQTDIVVDSVGRRAPASERIAEPADTWATPPEEPVRMPPRAAAPAPEPRPAARPTPPAPERRAAVSPARPEPRAERAARPTEAAPRQRTSPFAALRRLTGRRGEEADTSRDRAAEPERRPSAARPQPQSQPEQARRDALRPVAGGGRPAQARPEQPRGPSSPTPAPEGSRGPAPAQRGAAEASRPAGEGGAKPGQLEEMASRLEAALKRPAAPAQPASGDEERPAARRDEAQRPARPAPPQSPQGSSGAPGGETRSRQEPPSPYAPNRSAAPRPRPEGGPTAPSDDSAGETEGRRARIDNPFAPTRAPSAAPGERPGTAASSGAASAPRGAQPDTRPRPPSASPAPGEGEPRARSPEVDLAAAMAAELRRSSPRQSSQTPGSGSRTEEPSPAAPQRAPEEKQENKPAEGEEPNIYEQILRRDT